MLRLKRHFKAFIFIFLLLMLLGISFLSFSSYKKYSTPTLIGAWRSKETGEQIIFTEDGLVKFNNTAKTGSYIILSATKMEYTIDNKTFVMHYYIEGRELFWGIDDDSLENFSRHSVFNL